MGAQAFSFCKKRIHLSSQRPNEKYDEKSGSKKNDSNQSQQTLSSQDKIQQEKVDDERNYIKNLKNDLLLSIKLKSSQIFYQQASSSVTSSQTKRLMSEINVLRKNLPLYKSNSIFLRYDDGKINLMQSLIIGAEGTPYANGMFLYDIYFGTDYPQSPPKMQLMTTGYGQIRFNPNLYSCGKICLSLLGTWSGSQEEKWNESKSNLLQILLSIQSLVMNEGVYYNEPGHSSDKFTENGKKYNQAYSNIIKYGTIKFAIKDQLRNPPHGFEDVVKKHVFYKKQDILNQCQAWLKQAEKDDCYQFYIGLVQSHNYKFAADFSKEKLAYYNALKLEVDELTQEIDKLKI